MKKLLADLMIHLAEHASSMNENVLAHILRLGSLQAGKTGIHTPQTILGVWDWDVTSDRNHLDSTCADLFGMDRRLAKSGIPNVECLNVAHPTDLHLTAATIEGVLNTGGEFEAEYRIVANSRTRWVLAKGFCTLDNSGRPERLAGAILELPNWCAERKHTH